ncbi:YozQ family protein [Halalkalibacter krulwichiae]|uniref:DUF4025 domain-containing protein n=1 Tax=Halalkalibacter krulwichiae TaxID=199441 RepID=A0A1X9MCN8_9BACI|nr:YozQ family protein [Halalkalibacter krulwichiae]ARK31197.1 hypothetical protein BkAM31D_15780 [Halalkalibacter krulwichiae]
MSEKNNQQANKTQEVAEHSYQPEDYQSSNEVEKGLATTHEQVSDAYMEGTIDAEKEKDVNSNK